MVNRPRDTAFFELVTNSRSTLVGAAHLMFGRADHAEDVVQSVLAELYRDWPKGVDHRETALREVLTADLGRLTLPWRRGEHFELLDASTQSLIPPGIVADLAELSAQPRRVVILDRWVGMSLPAIAALLGAPVATVVAWSAAATARLVSSDPDRQLEGQLTAELSAAVLSATTTPDATADLAHGRTLVRRRGRRWLLIAAAVILVIILGVTQLGARLPAEQNEARGPVPGPARSVAACNTADAACRATVLNQWRTEMAAVTSSYLDPEGSYFAGYTFSDNSDDYETRGFWSGAGGALGFDMFKVGGGSTDVYVQIASSGKFAVHCGETTNHPCTSVKYMDGNTFDLTDTSRATEGLEVQYAPTVDAVITVVARSTAGGLTLGITRAEVVALAQDDRLRLPAV